MLYRGLEPGAEQPQIVGIELVERFVGKGGDAAGQEIGQLDGRVGDALGRGNGSGGPGHGLGAGAGRRTGFAVHGAGRGSLRAG
ncbi:hypothetical protein [Mycobacterium szulgai]|uniref:hypothetical protein n=1 Tax=Mycobacterium szulgai TaxID=1787 RepID=UPI0021F3B506|nr:hypothetical protein [Mycobacterium szulgai]